ncbi:MAG: ASPIC/UnbV domain-containing protein [Ignavibacteria bacterium]|nr:ASPIC/UnbV domain-containing protein [Ignavibacteria bacterium]
MDDKMSIGLGAATIIDSIIVQWPDGPVQVLLQQPVNSTVALDRTNAEPAAMSMFHRPRITNQCLLMQPQQADSLSNTVKITSTTSSVIASCQRECHGAVRPLLLET